MKCLPLIKFSWSRYMNQTNQCRIRKERTALFSKLFTYIMTVRYVTVPLALMLIPHVIIMAVPYKMHSHITTWIPVSHPEIDTHTCCLLMIQQHKSVLEIYTTQQLTTSSTMSCTIQGKDKNDDIYACDIEGSHGSTSEDNCYPVGDAL